MKVLLLFIDGVGLGDDAEYNPFAECSFPFWERLFQGRKLTRDLGLVIREDAALIPTDPRLDVKGIPQSATGQASIFTGRNAPAFVGAHQPGFPFQRLRKWIAQDNLYQRVQRMKKRPVFANPYPPDYFQRKRVRRGWMSVSTLTAYSSGIRFRTWEDLADGLAVSHDLTRFWLRERKSDIAPIEPERAALHLLRLLETHDLVVHEYFLTDVAGHKQDLFFLSKRMMEYDRFLETIALHKPEDVNVILCSDHGNCEDMRTRQHTMNDVPTLLLGKKAVEYGSGIRTLTDIAPLVIRLLQTDEKAVSD